MAVITVPISVDQALELCRDPDVAVELVAEAPGLALTIYVSTRLQRPLVDVGRADPPCPDRTRADRGGERRRWPRLHGVRLRQDVPDVGRSRDPSGAHPRQAGSAQQAERHEASRQGRRAGRCAQTACDDGHVRLLGLRREVRQRPAARRTPPVQASQPADRRAARCINIGNR